MIKFIALNIYLNVLHNKKSYKSTTILVSALKKKSQTKFQNHKKLLKIKH